MFDDPKKDLKWLEKQLRAAEKDTGKAKDVDWFQEGSMFQDRDWFAQEDHKEEEWLDEQLRDAHELMGDDAGRRKVTMYDYDAEADAEEPAPAVYTDTPKKKKAKKEKGIGGLVFLACLETLGIIAVLLWWALWLL